MSFHALELAIEIVRLVRRPIELIAAHDPDLARQLRKASTSVPMNTAEGGERRGRDRGYHFRVARSEAAETMTGLRAGEAAGYVEREDIAEALAAIDRVRAMLWRLEGR